MSSPQKLVFKLKEEVIIIKYSEEEEKVKLTMAFKKALKSNTFILISLNDDGEFVHIEGKLKDIQIAIAMACENKPEIEEYLRDSLKLLRFKRMLAQEDVDASELLDKLTRFEDSVVSKKGYES